MLPYVTEYQGLNIKDFEGVRKFVVVNLQFCELLILILLNILSSGLIVLRDKTKTFTSPACGNISST